VEESGFEAPVVPAVAPVVRGRSMADPFGKRKA